METLVEQSYEPVVGLDIGPDGIRVVELERIDSQYHLLNFGIAPMPEGAMQDGYVVQPRVVGKAIRELFAERRITNRRVVTAVRGHKVVSRLITLPAMPQDRLRRLIESEINRYVLFGSEDKIVFYHPMEEFEEDNARRVSVMLVIAERNLCYSYYEAIHAAGLECLALDMSSFAILRVLRNSMMRMQGSVMSLVYDYHGISMNVFHGDTIRYSRSLKLQTMSPAEMSNGFLDKCLSETLLALQFYQTEFSRGSQVRKLVVSLGASGGLDLYHILSDHIEDIPIEMHTPFNNIRVDVDAFPSHLMEQADLSFLTAVGLGLRGMENERLPFQVDLMPTEIAEMKRFLSWLRVPAALLLLTILTFAMLIFLNGRELERVRTDNKNRNASLSALNTNLAALKSQYDAQQAMAREQPAGRRTLNAHSLLAALSFNTPKTVQVISVDVAPPAADAASQPNAAAAAVQGADQGNNAGGNKFRAADVIIKGVTTDPDALKVFQISLQNIEPDAFKEVGGRTLGSITINETAVQQIELRARWEGQ